MSPSAREPISLGSPVPARGSRSARHAAERLSASDMAATLSRALREGVFGPSDTAVVFYDLPRLEDLLDDLEAAFPASTLHAVAVKANPLVEVLKRIRRRGLGAEVASLGELELALAAGFPAEAIVFDSPVKTRAELELALRKGIGINANSLGELARIDGLYNAVKSRSRVGIRINPEVGSGSIDSTSVAVQHSKLGVSLRECRTDLLRALSGYPWLSGVHVHLGSQGMSLYQLLAGIGDVYDFFLESRQRAGIRSFNVGGGLPAKYRESDPSIRFSDYAATLRRRCPALFDPDVRLVTEIGRALHASCGWAASRIEYVVAHADGTSTFLVHIGGDMFLRKAYRPADWHHDLSVCDDAGRLRDGPRKRFHVAGPLCFAGDYLGRGVSLPEDTREEDFLLIHDAGAYTFSMWSMYNSRQFPAVMSYTGPGEPFRRLRPRQSLAEILELWSAADNSSS